MSRNVLKNSASYKRLSFATELETSKISSASIPVPIRNNYSRGSRCPVSHCDGSGHITKMYDHHRSFSGCPLRDQLPKHCELTIHILCKYL